MLGQAVSSFRHQAFSDVLLEPSSTSNVNQLKESRLPIVLLPQSHYWIEYLLINIQLHEHRRGT